MRAHHQIIFFTELATILKSGLPLREGLQVLSRGSRSVISETARAIDNELEKGLSLSEALTHIPSPLPKEYIAIINAGEKAGKLPELLKSLVNEIEARQNALKKLVFSLGYPAFLIVLCCLVGPLPLLITKGKATYFGAVFGSVWPALIFIFGVWGLIKFRSRMGAARIFLENVFKAIPMLGRGIYQLSLGRTLQLLGVLQEAGISLSESFEIAEEASGFQSISDGLKKGAVGILNGAYFSEALDNLPGIPDLQKMELRAANQTGAYDQALKRCGDQLIDGAWIRLLALAKILPIIAMFIAGAMVFSLYAKALLGGLS